MYLLHSFIHFLSNVSMYHNNATLGGAYYIDSPLASLYISASIFNNTAQIGGGIYGTSGNMIVLNASVQNNTAVYGAGIYGLDSSITVLTSIVNGNAATLVGGGLLVSGSSFVNVTLCTFSLNSAQLGGGIFYNGSQIVVAYSNFTSNHAVNGSGIYLQAAYSALLTTVSFSGQTGVNGGGLYATDTQHGLEIDSCSASGNLAQDGAAYYIISNPSALFTENTITGNAGNSIVFLLSANNTEMFNSTISSNSGVGIHVDVTGPTLISDSIFSKLRRLPSLTVNMHYCQKLC